MPYFGYSRDERIYLLLESQYGVTPNYGGASTLAGSNCCLINSVELDPVVDLYDSEYKTGSRSMMPGQPGRKIGNFRITLPLKGNGTPGVPSDAAAILQSAFGSQTVNGGANVIYNLIDNPPVTFSMFRFRQPSQLCQYLGISCIPTRITWNLGQNMANWTVEGQCMWVLDSENFAVTDVTGRGGLTAFPGEPGNPTTNGVQAQGFVGSLTIDGNALVNIQSMQIVAEFGWSHIRDQFGTYYGAGILGGIRRITASMRAYDDTSAAMMDLRAKGRTKALMGVGATVGNVAGNRHTWTLGSCQFDVEKTADDGDRFTNQWSSIVAHESAPGMRDELVYTAS